MAFVQPSSFSWVFLLPDLSATSDTADHNFLLDALICVSVNLSPPPQCLIADCVVLSSLLPPLKWRHFQHFDSSPSGRHHPFKQVTMSCLCRRLPHVYHRLGSPLYLLVIHFCLLLHQRLSSKAQLITFLPKNSAILPCNLTSPFPFIKYSSSHLVPKQCNSYSSGRVSLSPFIKQCIYL